MHIPDGFLDTATSVATWAASAGGVSYAVRRVRQELDERQVPLMGVTAAFIFAAQMMNFTVIGGTSGHLLGGALAAILLGPWAGMLVLTSVLTVQALLFQDGGLLALGANIFNMGVISVFTAYFVCRTLARTLPNLSVAVATLLGVILGSVGAAVWVMLSHPYGLRFFSLMVITHAASGIVEAVVTVAVVSTLRAADLLKAPRLEVADV